ncbi:MAG: DUF512 domain-containing protein [Bacteroidetes bacterium]|nr:DUF512 domain-containing protein [Bacteroidota bacterium]
MRNRQGVIIESVAQGSFSEEEGIKNGDRIVSIDGNAVQDIIDLMFYADEPGASFIVKSDKKRHKFEIPEDASGIGSLGMTFKPFKVKTCRNNCIFCFVLQLPKGLRKTLYVKDEDYRMSFLYGNFITGTNLTPEDKRRIIEQRLSPLYISVHCTDTTIRNKMLGNPYADDILKHISFFAENRIKMHTQIVLCPGYNDRRYLAKTISDLYRFYPYVASIAVVPVGLTMHRKKKLRPVEKEDAENAIGIIGKFQSRFTRKHGENIVFASDEMYLKAGIPFPPIKHYDELPQIENGVGMVPKFLHGAKKIRSKDLIINNTKKFLTFTGVSFYPYLAKFVETLRNAGIDINAVGIENSFFGNSVTVAGLLTGRDVIKALSDIIKRDDILLIPDVVMKAGENIFLDDVVCQDIEDLFGVRTYVIESTPDGLVKAIAAISSEVEHN